MDPGDNGQRIGQRTPTLPPSPDRVGGGVFSAKYRDVIIALPA